MASRFSIEAVFSARDNFSRVFGRIEDNVSRSMRSIAAATRATQTVLSGAAKHTDRFVAGIANASKVVATVGAGAAAAGAFIVIKSGAAFEQAIADVAAVSGAAGAELDALKKRALDLGSTTKFAGVEVAGAMESMSKAGFATQDVLKGVSGLLSAAAADGGDLGEISTGLMATLKGFGAGADQLQPFADMMAKAGDSTAASIGSISESMVKFGPVARQLGVNAASAFAQVSLLQDAGMDAASAGTQLAAVYSKLVAPVGATKKEIAALGVSITDAAGNMRAPEHLFASILKATDGIQGNAGKMAAFTNLVGLESKTAMLNIAAAAKSGRLDQLTKDLGHAAGYADQIAAKRMNTLFGDWKLFGGAVDGVVNSLYDLQGGAMRGVLQSATAWGRANKDVIIQKFDGWVNTAARAIKAATPVVISFTGGLAAGAKDVTSALNAMKPPIVWTLDAVGSLFGDDDKDRARSFGRMIVWIGGGLVAVSAASRAAVGVQVGYRAAMVTGAFVNWAFAGSAAKSAEALTAQAGASTAAAGATASGLKPLATAGAFMLRFAVLAGLATAAYKSWTSAFSQNSDLKKQTGGLGFFDIMAMHPKDVKAEIDKRLDAEAKARRPEAAAAWTVKQYGEPSVAQVPIVKRPSIATAATTDVAGSLTSLLGGLDKQISELSNAPGVDAATVANLDSTIAAVTAAMPQLSLGPDAAASAGAASAQLDQLTASLKTFETSLPAARAGGSGVSAPIGAPAPGLAPVKGLAAPQLSLPREQSAEMARLIGVEVRRGMKEAMKETPIQVSVNGDGTATASTTPGQRSRPRVTDSGAP
jgi:TP901 family phage tail tape measure protein